MARIKKWTPCVVQWGDAVTIPDPVSSNDKFTVAERTSIGFFLRRDKHGITIAMEDDRRCADFGENDCQTVTTIPKGMVRKITVLVVEPETPKKIAAKEPDASE